MRGSDTDRVIAKLNDMEFQSTLPVRGSDMQVTPFLTAVWISIHAPREGERRLASGTLRGEELFQSTLPVRGSDPRTI